MAFAGTPVIKIVSDNLVRISGPFYLPSGETGTIGLHENAGIPGIRLPAAFKPRPYAGADDQLVGLQDSLRLTVDQLTPVGLVLTVTKSGTDLDDFLFTMVGDGGVDTGDLQIYVSFH